MYKRDSDDPDVLRLEADLLRKALEEANRKLKNAEATITRLQYNNKEQAKLLRKVK